MSLIESLPRVNRLRLPRADGLIPWIVPLAIILIWQVACETGLVSAQWWHDQASAELERARRLGGPVGVLMLDLDRFKRINDRFGHPAGDDVLRAVADAIRRAVRGTDLVGRWGGEEFAVLLPGVDTTGAAAARQPSSRPGAGPRFTSARTTRSRSGVRAARSASTSGVASSEPLSQTTTSKRTRGSVCCSRAATSRGSRWARR